MRCTSKLVLSIVSSSELHLSIISPQFPCFTSMDMEDNVLHREPHVKCGEIPPSQSPKPDCYSSNPMASLASSFSHPLSKNHCCIQRSQHSCVTNQRTVTIKHGLLRIYAAQSSNPQPRAPPGVDTRIHWENENEGWIGGTTSKSAEEQLKTEENLLDKRFSDLLNSSSNSHYQFLGVSADADMEEIKAAYRRLSKEYHPDTTSLPLKVASDKFMKLREVYDVLSDEEKRKFYDWTLAQEAASREAEKMRMKLEDPYMQEVKNWESVPDMVDRLGGRNMELSDQAKSALTFDIFIILFSICCIVYAIFFKEY